MKIKVFIILLGSYIFFSNNAYCQIDMKASTAQSYIEALVDTSGLITTKYDTMHEWEFFLVIEGTTHGNIYKVAVDDSLNVKWIDRVSDSNEFESIDLGTNISSGKSDAAIAFTLSRFFRGIVPRVHPMRVCVSVVRYGRTHESIEGIMKIRVDSDSYSDIDNDILLYYVGYNVSPEGLLRYRLMPH